MEDFIKNQSDKKPFLADGDKDPAHMSSNFDENTTEDSSSNRKT